MSHASGVCKRRLAEVVPIRVSLETTEAMMSSFRWNSLTTGDRVMLHDDLDPGVELHEGKAAS